MIAANEINFNRVQTNGGLQRVARLFVMYLVSNVTIAIASMESSKTKRSLPKQSKFKPYEAHYASVASKRGPHTQRRGKNSINI